jgi:type I restriction enzyme S subunit
MSYARYPQYKDSGIEWLSEVPTHWVVTRIKNSINAAKNGVWGDEPTAENGILCVRVADFDRRNNAVVLDNPTYRSISENDKRGRLLKYGDLLIEKSGGGDNQPVGFVVIYEHNQEAVTSNFIAKLDVEPSTDSRFLLYVFTKLYAERVNVRSIKQNTGIQNLDTNQYFNEQIALPPPREQRAIAAFLDRETARIDMLIAKQEQMIALLQEKRKATISHAVTRGINPDVPLKDSGVEWLGMVPEHWEVKAIKRLSPVQRGASPRPIDDPKYFDDDGEFAWVRIADVTASRTGYLYQTTQRLSESGSSLSVKLQPGELFLSIAGSVGKACITQIKACIHDGFVYFPYLRDDPKFLFYIFEAGEAYKGLGKLGTQLNLNTDTVGAIKIGVPPIDEQQQIVEYIDRETDKIDTLIGKAQTAIDLLKEHRTSLISAAVTGKIDVRGL